MFIAALREEPVRRDRLVRLVAHGLVAELERRPIPPIGLGR